ncbi:hypothetical protein [Paracholeplasma manati]|uniref:Family 2 glycosyl transferase n=1 Tax=Paracholeplasma manati TaxID=591373 RepID=A0ABT2Y5N0_9MOLU|nr:hypothetical protein [Paracholeplasma manati]MCV2232054.1 hypothetical protein [Paracholeplasma manati]MDG0887829.1 hypothetical protein [Paracholeplasma manati]
MKKLWLYLTTLTLMTILGSILVGCTQPKLSNTVDGLTTSARIHDGDFYIYNGNKMEKSFIKGVNIGATKPGYFPGELAITKLEYIRWFFQISEMNANTIRVYTTMTPAFYDALFEFNERSRKKLYVMHGLWLNEDKIKAIHDPYAEDEHLLQEFISDGQNLVDIFHGNKTLDPRPGFASGTYTYDISKYIIGWVLGVEWDSTFVHNTNQLHPTINHFEGQFLYTENASPFEAFLAKAGDAILSYEAEHYQTTRPLSYTNWLTTDPLTHPNEPDPKEDLASVDVEHIKTMKKAFAGQFASYHVYPYYPEFMNFSTDLIDAYDPINTYRAYLDQLNAYHTMPVLVAEFGVPASRGKAHDARYSRFNQGQHTEKEQGEMLVSMIKDIHDAGSIGALIFAWQDEWFKRTWNTMDFDLEWQRPFWSNVETNEQMFGLLSFEPGETLKIKLDGSIADWEDVPYVQMDDLHLKATQDERYIYLLVELNGHVNEPIYIGIDTIPNQGNLSYPSKQITFNRDADFLITIDETSRIEVDPYYDAFSHLYGDVLDMIDKPLGMYTINSGLFTGMYHALSKELHIPGTNEVIPFSKYEAGLFKEGISDPSDPNYNSLADYYQTNDYIEIRIPYLLLNIMDPSTKTRMANFKGDNVFVGEPFDHIYIGASTGNDLMSLAPYTWDNWGLPTYHERLKQSYYIVQDTFRIY